MFETNIESTKAENRKCVVVILNELALKSSTCRVVIIDTDVSEQIFYIRWRKPRKVFAKIAKNMPVLL